MPLDGRLELVDHPGVQQKLELVDVIFANNGENPHAQRTDESPEQIYARAFRAIKPKTRIPAIVIRFRKYVNANSRIRLHEDQLTVDISDFLEGAPSIIQEALAVILISKLFRKAPGEEVLARYRRYLNKPEVRRSLEILQRARGRKNISAPAGRTYDLEEIFEDLNRKYFGGLMARPQLGWSRRAARTTLGHYDPSHHTIVLSKLMDTVRVPAIVVQYVMFHEMLHLKFPAEQRGARRCVHTREFRRAEKTFESFQEAQHAIKRFLAG